MPDTAGTQSVVSSQNIHLRGITKSFGTGRPALAPLSFEIRAKELLVLLGPSGCGKTTLLNLLAGLEEPTAGDIYFGESKVTDLPAERRHVSMVFQSIGLYPHLNVIQNIRFPLRILKMSIKEIDERIVPIAEILGISYVLGRRLNELSGGERQRVAIAKALVKRPFLFLLDEAFSNLDADRRRQMRSELVRVHQELDTTMVFVTHDQEEAMSIAERIAVIREGELVQVGTPLEIYQTPVNVWVSQFIGNHPICIFVGVFNATDSSILIEDLSPEPLSLPEEVAQQWASAGVHSRVTVGVRPERVRVSQGSGDIPVTVAYREVLGESLLYHLEATPGAALRALLPSTATFPARADVRASIEWSNILLFDTAKEDALERSLQTGRSGESEEPRFGAETMLHSQRSFIELGISDDE